ncbi:hypothetical protein BGZ98_004956 [Dissophora globulifera]|nr:hypothetical protein BGZ98_004956 [Dissophora globulifera]
MMVGWTLIAASAIIIAQIALGQTYWHFAFPTLIVNCLSFSPIWMYYQVNTVANADGEDQGVIGADFNVVIQLGDTGLAPMSEAPTEDQEKGISAVESSSVRTVLEVDKAEVVEVKTQTLSA